MRFAASVNVVLLFFFYKHCVYVVVCINKLLPTHICLCLPVSLFALDFYPCSSVFIE